MATNEEMIKQMYGSQLDSQKEQLRTDYETAVSDMDAQQAAARKALEKNIGATKVQAQKSAMNNEEYYAASGLTSGAKAQARLASENQLQADLTALRTAQQETDAEVERQRALLSKEYASAIRKAQADNDLALAQALYEEAEQQEAKLLAKQEAAASIMAGVGSYDLYGQLYGLSAEDIQRLTDNYNSQQTAAAAAAQQEAADLAYEQELAAAKLMADNGDYTRLAQLYGLTEAELRALNEEADPEPVVPAVPGPNVTTPGERLLEGLTGIDFQTSSGNTQGQAIDTESISALGYGEIDAAELDRLIRQGYVEEYVENGVLKYRKVNRPAGGGGGVKSQTKLMIN